MDSRKLAFLQAVVGHDGARALAKAACTPDMEWAIFPRVVMSWLEAITQYTGHLPGVHDTRLILKKGEGDYSGCINIGPDEYTFRDVSLFHVAGSVAVALGSDHQAPPPLQHPALPRLGQSIDLLVKARLLRKAGGKAGGGAKGPGPAAAPQGPLAPIPPTPTAPKPSGPIAGTKIGGAGQKASQSPEGIAKPTGPKLPGVKPAKLPAVKKPTAVKLPGVKMKVTKAEAAHRCPTCAEPQFKADQYVACLCFKDLRKSVETTVIEGGYILTFGRDWDREAVTTLAENLGK
jgi:hypothetical protein